MLQANADLAAAAEERQHFSDLFKANAKLCSKQVDNDADAKAPDVSCLIASSEMLTVSTGQARSAVAQNVFVHWAHLVR